MQLRTYTGLWNVERRLYKFYDISLPYPVSIKQVGVFIASVVPWFMILSFLHVPFSPPFGEIIWLAPPIALTWWSNRPVAEGKGLYDFCASQIKFFLSSKTYAALAPVKADPATVEIEANVWSEKLH